MDLLIDQNYKVHFIETNINPGKSETYFSLINNISQVISQINTGNKNIKKFVEKNFGKKLELIETIKFT